MDNSGSRTEVNRAPTRPLRILLVDDSDLFRHVFLCLLSNYPGICVIGQAANGREGFALAAKLQPDLVITDLEMPELDGLQLVELLRREYPRMRSLLVSCHDGPTLPTTSLQHGADGFVTKQRLPIELPALMARLFPEPTPDGTAAAPDDDRSAP